MNRPRLATVVATGLHGAFLLGRGRAEGLAFLDPTPEGALRSFWAAAICLPAFLGLRFLAWGGGDVPPAGLAQSLLVELVGYTCNWVGFALLSRPLARASGRLPLWPHYVSAWNWTNVVQWAALLLLTLPAGLGLPPAAVQGLSLAAVGYALWLEWFATRVALQLPGSRAVLFVAADLILGLFMDGLVQRLSGQ